MGRAVERLPLGRVEEAVVGTAVDHQDVTVERRSQLTGVTGWQREEDHVVVRQGRWSRLEEHVFGQRDEMGVQLAQSRPGGGSGGERPDLDIGVTAEQAEQLATDVTAGTSDSDLEHSETVFPVGDGQ